MAISIKLIGDYYSVVGNLKTLKKFEEVLKAPSLEFFRQTTQRYMGTSDDGKLIFKTNSFVNIRGILKKKLLPQILQKKFTDFTRLRKITIESITAEDGSMLPELPIILQSREQLAAYCTERHIPILVSEYMELDELRSDITLYLEDADSFMSDYKQRQAKRDSEREFMELNGLIAQAPAITPAVAAVAAVPATKAKKAKAVQAPVAEPVAFDGIE